MPLTRWLTTTTVSFCILLMQFATPLLVTYQPVDHDVLLCSAEYTLFVESNFTVAVKLDQAGTFTLSSSHSGGHVETGSHANDGISPTVVNQALTLTGMYNITITATPGRIWRKEIRVSNSPIEIQDATVTQKSVMPGELLSGQVNNQEGEFFYYLPRIKVSLNLCIIWTLIRRLFNVMLWTSDRRKNNVLCLLG